MLTVESLMVFDFLVLLAKYSYNENSPAIASKECRRGDLLPEAL